MMSGWPVLAGSVLFVDQEIVDISSTTIGVFVSLVGSGTLIIEMI